MLFPLVCSKKDSDFGDRRPAVQDPAAKSMPEAIAAQMLKRVQDAGRGRDASKMMVCNQNSRNPEQGPAASFSRESLNQASETQAQTKAAAQATFLHPDNLSSLLAVTDRKPIQEESIFARSAARPAPNFDNFDSLQSHPSPLLHRKDAGNEVIEAKKGRDLDDMCVRIRACEAGYWQWDVSRTFLTQWSFSFKTGLHERFYCFRASSLSK